MPIDDLTALGQKMREARKKKDLTQQELADLSHVSVKQIASIEKGQINPSYLILKALAKVLPLSLDTLINPNVSPEDEGANQMKMLYCSWFYQYSSFDTRSVFDAFFHETEIGCRMFRSFGIRNSDAVKAVYVRSVYWNRGRHISDSAVVCDVFRYSVYEKEQVPLRDFDSDCFRAVRRICKSHTDRYL